MNYQAGQFRTLEARFERLLLDFQALQAQVANLATQIAGLQQGGGGGGQSGGGGQVFIVSAPTAGIAAGGSLGSQTIYIVSAGALVQISTTATVYNEMAAATVAAKPLVCGLNNDGTYTAITQSC